MLARFCEFFMKKILIITLLLAGCGNMPSLPSLPSVSLLQPYKIDIQQGNHVTQDMLDKLKPGMSRSQVRFALGTPLLVDPFRTDRWDYVYTYQKQGGVIEQRTVTVVFRGEQLDRIEGDVAAAKKAAAVNAPAGKAAPAVEKK